MTISIPIAAAGITDIKKPAPGIEFYHCKRGISTMTTEISIIVRYAETDQMGIVHHSNYPVWFEAGRTDFFRKIGMPYSAMEATGIILPLSEMNCLFKNPAKYGDEIVIKTGIQKMTCVKIEFEYDVFNNTDGKSLAVGHTIHAWTDKALRPVNIQKKRPEVFDLLKSII